jgi:hypothetical protein
LQEGCIASTLSPIDRADIDFSMDTYGDDHEELSRYILSFGLRSMSVELIEVFKEQGESLRVKSETYTSFDPLKQHLCKEVGARMSLEHCLHILRSCTLIIIFV